MLESVPHEEGEMPSIWHMKPWWCKPWSIVFTGVAVVAASWMLLHRWWITGPLSLGVALWWLLFLVLVPKAYRLEHPQLAQVSTIEPAIHNPASAPSAER